MDYNNKNRNEVRVFSVTMTKEELKLFSEFLEQKEFDVIELRDNETGEIIKREVNLYDLDKVTSRSAKEALKKENERLKNLDEFDYSDDYHLNSKSILDAGIINPEINRLSLKVANQFDNEKNKERVIAKGEFLRNRTDENYQKVKNIVELRDKPVRDIIDKENRLAESRYDDKYSSKRFEKFLDKKIDADKAKNIVDRRHEKDTDYLAKDMERGRDRDNFHISDLGRKWNDTGIVYNEALGRNLNKDAAIAAGVTAGLVGGGVALRKHLKRKKAEKEIAEKRYKTSDKKKK